MQPKVSVGDSLNQVFSLYGANAGVLLANLQLFSGDVYMSQAQRAALPTAPLDIVIRALVHGFVDNKFIGLFALLFGLGFSIQMARARARPSRRAS